MAAPKNSNVKDEILTAAIDLLKQQMDISLADIAKAAGISKGTLFYHYKSKADIYLAIGDRYWSRLSDELLRWVDNKEKITTPPRLVRYTMQRGVFDESGPLRLHLFVDAVSHGEDGTEVREALIHQYVHFQEILKSRIQERMPDSDGENLAWMLLALVDGLMVQNTLHNHEIDIDGFIEWMAAHFVHN
ncbi:MAG: TetR/AcrR family transcriptional regulator [Clostridia bacterium]